MLKVFDIMATAAANWINGGAFARRSRMQATDIAVDSHVIFTDSGVRKVIKIRGLKPVNSDIAFIEYVRDHMFMLDPDVDVIITQDFQPVRISPTDQKFSRGFARASESYTTYKEAFDSQKGMARLVGKTYNLGNGVKLRLSKDKLDDLYQMFVSYYEVFKVATSGEGLAQTQVYVELCAADVKVLARAERDLYNILAPLEAGSAPVHNALKSYLNEFAPMNPVRLSHNKKLAAPMLFTEANAAAFSSYKARGLVGVRGLLLGLDFRSRFPFMVDIFSSPSAQVFLLAGITGSGKTYAAFGSAVSALALGQHVSAIDIKGREWSKLQWCMEPKVLTFDDKHPSFVNTLRLDDLAADSSNCLELYSTAVKGTVNLLSLIVNLQPSEGSSTDLEMVLRESVIKLYSNNSVEASNPRSFKNSAGLRYVDILPVLENLSHISSYTKDQCKIIALARARCYAYLGESGVFAEAFRNEVTLSDILTSQFVIYEFNKNQNAMTDSLDVLRIFMVQFLDSKKKAMLRDKNLYLFCYYEELARCDQFGQLLEYICADVTGSRSNNAVIFLLLNSLRVLDNERARDIRSNITSFIIGKMNSHDIEILENDFEQTWIASQLRLFADKPSVYRNCFAANIDTGSEQLQTVYKVVLPDGLSDKFRTRSVGLTRED